MPELAAITSRLANLGGAQWALHFEAKARQAAGEDILMLTIGQADAAPPPQLRDALVGALDAGRIGYSSGPGERRLRQVLAARYSKRTGRKIDPEQCFAFPGTQSALYTCLAAMVEAGDEVIVADPYYATYPGLVAAPGAVMRCVQVSAETGYRLTADAVRAALSPKTKVLWLNTPHNPTGAVLSVEDIQALGAIAQEHDLWILSDEVYEELVFPGQSFVSPFDDPVLAERTVLCASISKSHAAPGYRAGWAVGPEAFMRAMQPIAEMMLFGIAPFIQDAMAEVVGKPSAIGPKMTADFAQRAERLVRALNGRAGLSMRMPQAGMFVILEVGETGLSGDHFARLLLRETGVAVMPGPAFGAALHQAVRISLTATDAEIDQAAIRIAAFAEGLAK